MSDRDACLAVFDSQALAHRQAFVDFLDAAPSNFTVLEHEGVIVGCGGWTIVDHVALLVHGMIHRDYQKMGLGRFLLLYRLRQVSKSGSDVQFVRATAPPETALFHQKQGFKPTGAQDAASVEVIMKLTVCP